MTPKGSQAVQLDVCHCGAQAAAHGQLGVEEAVQRWATSMGCATGHQEGCLAQATGLYMQRLICISIYMYIQCIYRIYICIYIYIHRFVCIYINYIYTYIYTCIYIPIYIHNACMQPLTYEHAGIYVYICTYIYVYIYI